MPVVGWGVSLMLGGRWRGLSAAVLAILLAGTGTVRLAHGNAARYDNGRLDPERLAVGWIDGDWSGRRPVSEWSASPQRRGDPNVFRARLTGFVADTRVVSSTGSGYFSATLQPASREIGYRLSYADLAGDVTQARLHLGSGDVSVVLCSNLGDRPPGTRTCPAAPVTTTGIIRPADATRPAGQGMAAGEFDTLVAAIRAGTTYVDVHSSRYPDGEIRARLGRWH